QKTASHSGSRYPISETASTHFWKPGTSTLDLINSPTRNRSKFRARRIFTSPQAALSVLIDGRFTYEDVRDQEERWPITFHSGAFIIPFLLQTGLFGFIYSGPHAPPGWCRDAASRRQGHRDWGRI